MVDTFRLVNNLLFDFGGTIEYPGEHLNERLIKYLEPYGTGIVISQIDTVALETVRHLYSIPDSRTLSYAEVLRFFVFSCLERLGVPKSDWWDDVVSRFLSESQAEVHKNIPVLTTLKEKYRLAVLSNNYGNTEGILRDYGIDHFFEAIYDSTVVGLRKPYPEFFQYALDDLGWKAEETAYIGDRFDRDMEAPKLLGMKTIWVVGGTERSCPDERLVDARISCLADIVTRLPRTAK